MNQMKGKPWELQFSKVFALFWSSIERVKNNLKDTAQRNSYICPQGGKDKSVHSGGVC